MRLAWRAKSIWVPKASFLVFYARARSQQAKFFLIECLWAGPQSSLGDSLGKEISVWCLVAPLSKVPQEQCHRLSASTKGEDKVRLSVG